MSWRGDRERQKSHNDVYFHNHVFNPDVVDTGMLHLLDQRTEPRGCIQRRIVSDQLVNTLTVSRDIRIEHVELKMRDVLLS